MTTVFWREFLEDGRKRGRVGSVVLHLFGGGAVLAPGSHWGIGAGHVAALRFRLLAARGKLTSWHHQSRAAIDSRHTARGRLLGFFDMWSVSRTPRSWALLVLVLSTICALFTPIGTSFRQFRRLDSSSHQAQLPSNTKTSRPAPSPAFARATEPWPTRLPSYPLPGNLPTVSTRPPSPLTMASCLVQSSRRSMLLGKRSSSP